MQSDDQRHIEKWLYVTQWISIGDTFQTSLTSNADVRIPYRVWCSWTEPQALETLVLCHLNCEWLSELNPLVMSDSRGSSEQLSACGSSGPSSTTNSNSPSPVKSAYPNQSNISPVKPGPLPANLDDLKVGLNGCYTQIHTVLFTVQDKHLMKHVFFPSKVSELRQHLRIRGMPVSGTKTALIERLRPFKDSNAGSSPSGSSDITTVTFPVTPTGSLSSYQSPSSSSALSQGGYYPYPSTSSTPPISPASSELSLSGSLPDSFSDVPMSSPPQFALQSSPAQLSMEDGVVGGGGGGNQGGGGEMAGEGGAMEGLEAEKDKMLVEKQKVIEELTWKLHQEQRQVGDDLSISLKFSFRKTFMLTV